MPPLLYLHENHQPRAINRHCRSICSNNALDNVERPFKWHIVKYRLDWICKTWTVFAKHGFVNLRWICKTWTGN